jgi:hypothetical protein
MSCSGIVHMTGGLWFGGWFDRWVYGSLFGINKW